MTEAEWLAEGVPRTILASLFSRATRRVKASRRVRQDERFRLFGIACCRRVDRVLESGDQLALDLLELYAREGSREALLRARRYSRAANAAASLGMREVDRADLVTVQHAAARNLASSAVGTCTKTKPGQAAMSYREAARAAASLELVVSGVGGPLWADYEPPSQSEMAAQCDILRDIFGNPFRPAAFDHAWRSDTALSLARVMYETREFSAMPILADALQDTGCEDADILAHCRGDGVHVSGCWVVDLVLGKE